MPKPDIKGLEKLAAHLRDVPRKQFNMDSWIVTTPCHTSGCIAGHAAMLFPHRFKRELQYSNNTTKGYYIRHIHSGYVGVAGFASAFRISIADADDITVSDRSIGFVTPKQAARAVTQLVNKLKCELADRK